MVVINALMKVDSQYLEEFIEKVDTLVKASQSEEGNISYSLYRDVKQPNVFVMVEKWKGQEDIDLHVQSPHFTQFIDYAQKVLLEPLRAERYYPMGN